MKFDRMKALIKSIKQMKNQNNVNGSAITQSDNAIIDVYFPINSNPDDLDKKSRDR